MTRIVLCKPDRDETAVARLTAELAEHVELRWDLQIAWLWEQDAAWLARFDGLLRAGNLPRLAAAVNSGDLAMLAALLSLTALALDELLVRGERGKAIVSQTETLQLRADDDKGPTPAA